MAEWAEVVPGLAERLPSSCGARRCTSDRCRPRLTAAFRALRRQTREALQEACVRNMPECAPDEHGSVAVNRFLYALTQSVIEDKLCAPACACACHSPATIDHFEFRNSQSVFNLLFAMVQGVEYDGKNKLISLHRSVAETRDVFTFGDQKVLVDGAPTTLFELEEACVHAPDWYAVAVDDIVTLVDSATRFPPPTKKSEETPEVIAKNKVRFACEWTVEHGYTRACDCAAVDRHDAPGAAKAANCVVCNLPLHVDCYPTLVCRLCQVCPIPCVDAMRTRADGWRSHRVPFTFVSLPGVQACMLTRVHGPKNVVMSMLVLEYRGNRYIARMPHTHGRKLIHLDDAVEQVMRATQAVGTLEWMMNMQGFIERAAMAEVKK